MCTDRCMQFKDNTLRSVSYRDLIGVPYKVHGRSIEEGFDCYGIAIEVLKRNGLLLEDVFYKDSLEFESTRDKVIGSLSLEKIEKMEELSIIEISCFGVPSHIGVYLGQGQMIHSTKATGVCIVPIHIYKNRIRGIYKAHKLI